MYVYAASSSSSPNSAPLCPQRGLYLLTFCAIDAMWSGVVPQQPPSAAASVSFATSFAQVSASPGYVHPSGVGCDLLERIEVHYHQIDWLDIVPPHLLLMRRVGAARKDSTVNLRMQGLDPAVEHLRKAGEV